jgi:hypothetical protein
VHSAATQATDIESFRPRRAQALDVRLDAGRHPALGLWTREQQLGHGTLRFQRRPARCHVFNHTGCSCGMKFRYETVHWISRLGRNERASSSIQMMRRRLGRTRCRARHEMDIAATGILAACHRAPSSCRNRVLRRSCSSEASCFCERDCRPTKLLVSAVDPACKKSSLDVIPRKPGRAFRHAAHLASSKRYTASRALMEASMAVNGTDPVGRWWHRSAWRRLLCDHPTGPLAAGRRSVNCK